MAEGEEPKIDRDKHLIQLKALRKIIDKYADEINSFEVKSIPELKAFINPNDAAVKKVVAKLKEEFERKSGKPYSIDYNATLWLAAFHFVSSLETIEMDLPVSFWFTPSDVMELGAADAFDRAIFLASLMVELGASAKVHVLETEGGIRHPVVIVNSDKCYLFDAYPSPSFLTGSTQNGVLTDFSLAGKRYTRSLFEFSQNHYEEF